MKIHIEFESVIITHKKEKKACTKHVYLITSKGLNELILSS